MTVKKTELVKGTYSMRNKRGRFSYQSVNPGPELTEFLFGNNLQIEEETREGEYIIYEDHQISELQYRIESHELNSEAILRDSYQSHYFKNGAYKGSIIQQDGTLENKTLSNFKIPEPTRTELIEYKDPIVEMLVGDYL